MMRWLVLLFAAAIVVGCAEETVQVADQGSVPAETKSGESKASTDSQLSLNPDYKPK